MNDENRSPSEWDGEPVGPTDEIPAGGTEAATAPAAEATPADETTPADEMPAEGSTAESASVGAPRRRRDRWSRRVRRVVRRPSTRRGRGVLAGTAAVALLLLGGGGGFLLAAGTGSDGGSGFSVDGGHGHHHGNDGDRDGADED
jgi:hypothetical protein